MGAVRLRRLSISSSSVIYIGEMEYDSGWMNMKCDGYDNSKMKGWSAASIWMDLTESK